MREIEDIRNHHEYLDKMFPNRVKIYQIDDDVNKGWIDFNPNETTFYVMNEYNMEQHLAALLSHGHRIMLIEKIKRNKQQSLFGN